MSRIRKIPSLKASLIVLGALVLAGSAMADELQKLVDQAMAPPPPPGPTAQAQAETDMTNAQTILNNALAAKPQNPLSVAIAQTEVANAQIEVQVASQPGAASLTVEQMRAQAAVQIATNAVNQASNTAQTEAAATALANANAQLTAANQAVAVSEQGVGNILTAAGTNAQIAQQAFAADQNLSPDDPKYQHDKQALALANAEAAIAALAALAPPPVVMTMDQLKAHAELALALKQLQTLENQQPPATPQQIAQANAAINQWNAAVTQTDARAANTPTATKIADSILAAGAAKANLDAATADPRSRKTDESRKVDAEARKVDAEAEPRLKAVEEKDAKRKGDARLDEKNTRPQEVHTENNQDKRARPVGANPSNVKLDQPKLNNKMTIVVPVRPEMAPLKPETAPQIIKR